MCQVFRDLFPTSCKVCLFRVRAVESIIGSGIVLGDFHLQGILVGLIPLELSIIHMSIQAIYINLKLFL